MAWGKFPWHRTLREQSACLPYQAEKVSAKSSGRSKSLKFIEENIVVSIESTRNLLTLDFSHDLYMYVSKIPKAMVLIAGFIPLSKLIELYIKISSLTYFLYK